MKTIEYFKLQAKNLHKDFKTQTSYFDSKLGRNLYEYEPKYFKIDNLVFDFEINQNQFKLMNAQHIIAKLSGFNKWTDMSNVSSSRLELSKLLYDNMDRVSVRDWERYISGVEAENKLTLDDEFKLQIFKEVFLEGEQDTFYDDYRLSPSEESISEKKQKNRRKSKPTAKISSLPLNKHDREEFIIAANQLFERIFGHIEPDNPELTRSLWNAETLYRRRIIKT
jgi:hypothetical protein